MEKINQEGKYEIIRIGDSSKYFNLAQLVPEKISNTQSYNSFLEYLDRNGLNRDKDYDLNQRRRFDTIFPPFKINVNHILKIMKIININNFHSKKGKYSNYPITEFTTYSGFNGDEIYFVRYNYLGVYCKEYKTKLPSALLDIIIINSSDSVLLYKNGKTTN